MVYGIKNAQKTFELQDGSFSTFQEWVETITFNGDTFIESCELGTDDSIHVIFDKKHEQTITKLFGSDFKQMAEESFHDESIQQIFHPTDFRVSRGRNFSNAEVTYAEKLKTYPNYTTMDLRVLKDF